MPGSAAEIDAVKATFQAALATALTESAEFRPTNNRCAAEEIAQVLFHFGLTWKDGGPSRAAFMGRVGVCIRACCQIDG